MNALTRANGHAPDWSTIETGGGITLDPARVAVDDHARWTVFSGMAAMMNPREIADVFRRWIEVLDPGGGDPPPHPDDAMTAVARHCVTIGMSTDEVVDVLSDLAGAVPFMADNPDAIAAIARCAVEEFE